MEKPQKPTPDFPLFPHASGKWAKKIGGRMKYFGRWENPDIALKEYLDTTTLTMDLLCRKFMEYKKIALGCGQIGKMTYADYQRTCVWIKRFMGPGTLASDLHPHDFMKYKASLAKKRSPTSVGNEVARVKILFKWAFDCELLEKPVVMGPDFRKPTAREVRRAAMLRRPKLLTKEQIHLLLDESGVQMRAMILLGINCGFGPTDCSQLPLSALTSGWIDFPRPKTYISRRCPLWPETEELLSKVRKRRQPSDLENVFIKPSGQVFTQDVISKRFAMVRRDACLTGGGFYWLRHTFATVAGNSRDQVAVDLIMGHADNTMAAQYRHGVDDQRLRDVVEHVREWLGLPE